MPRFRFQRRARRARSWPSVYPQVVGPQVSPRNLSPDPNPLPASVPCVVADFKCLDDGRVFEVVASIHDPDELCFAVYDGIRTFLADGVESSGERFVPPDRHQSGLGDIRLPNDVRDYASFEQLFWWTDGFIKECVDLPEHYRLIVSCFVAYTWFSDRMPTAVYLHVTGLPQSGKTTLLEVLGMLCRRPVLVSDISSAATYEICTRFGPTLIVDESDWEQTLSNRTWRKQLRAGTKREFRGKRRSSSSHTFGPKIFGSLALPDDAALKTRCIHVPMEETNRQDLKKTWDPTIKEAANALQARWMRFRLENYRSIGPRIPDGVADLRPRSQDMAASLLGALPTADKVYEDVVTGFFRHFHDPKNRDLLSSKQRIVLAGLFHIIHVAPEGGTIQIGRLAKAINELAAEANERIVFSPRELSPVLASLGFSARERSAAGQFLPLDRDAVVRVHHLWRRYGCKSLAHPDLAQHTTACSVCQNPDGAATKTAKTSKEAD